jgi:hypothetical protein
VLGHNVESTHSGCGPIEVSLTHSISNKGSIKFREILEQFNYCTFLTEDLTHTVNSLC